MPQFLQPRVRPGSPASAQRERRAGHIRSGEHTSVGKEWPSWCDGTDHEQALHFPYQLKADDSKRIQAKMDEMTRAAVAALCTSTLYHGTPAGGGEGQAAQEEEAPEGEEGGHRRRGRGAAPCGCGFGFGSGGASGRRGRSEGRAAPWRLWR